LRFKETIILLLKACLKILIIGSRFWKSFFDGRAIRLLVHVTKRFGQCFGDSVFE